MRKRVIEILLLAGMLLTAAGYQKRRENTADFFSTMSCTRRQTAIFTIICIYRTVMTEAVPMLCFSLCPVMKVSIFKV